MSMVQRPRLLPLACVIAAATWAGVAHAQTTLTWRPAPTSDLWSLGTNWTANVAPAANDSLVFGMTTGPTTLNNDIAAATQFNGITFNVGGSAYTLTGNQITLGGAVTNNSANLQTIALPLELAASQTMAANSGGITVTGPITGSGGITKQGRDTLTLAGTNTFSGAIAVNAGTLLLDYSAGGNTADPLGTSAITLDMGTLVLKGRTAGATTETISALNMGNNLGVANTLRLDANGGSGIDLTVTSFGLSATTGNTQNFNLVDLSSSSGNSLTASGLSASTAVINGVVMQSPSAGSGRANLVVRDSSGYGFATLSGATSGTLGRLAAGTTLNDTNSSSTTNYRLTTAGTLTRTASLDYSTITLDSSAGDVTLAMGANNLAPTGSGRGILVTGPNNVSITGSGQIAGAASSWFHNYSSGTFTLGQSPTLATASSWMFGGTGLTVWTGTSAGNAAINNRFYIEGGTFRPTADQAWIGAAGGISIGSVVVSSGAVLEVGADLNGATVGDLTNPVQASASLGGGIQFYGDSGVSAFGGDRVVGFRTSGTGALQSLTWGANSFLTQANGSTDGNFIFKLSSDRSDSLVTMENNVALGSLVRTVEVANGSAAVDADLSGVLSGSGGLTKTGGGTLRLSGVNTFTGPATIAAGTLVLGNSAALSGAAYSTDGQGGTLSFASLSAASLGSLSGGNGLALQNADANALALTVGGNGSSTTFSGVLSGPGSLTKSGAGTLTLSADSTYAGATTVNAGTLVVGTGSTTGSIGAGNVILGGGALQFSRSDTVTPSQTISGSGTLRMLSPGDTASASGVLVLSGSNSFAGTTSLERGTIRVTSSDALGTSAVVMNDSHPNKSLELVGGVTLTNAITLRGGGLTQTGVLASVSGFNTLTNFNFGLHSSTRLRFDAGSTLRITNNISDPTGGNNSYRVIGGGTLMLDGDNTAAFRLDATARFFVGLSGTGNGTIAVGNDLALGTAAVQFDASSTLRSASAAARSLANPMILGTSAAQFTLGSADTGPLALSGSFTLQHTGRLAVANSLTTISGAVSGTGFGFRKTGLGTLALSGLNTFTGAVTVSNGTLVADYATADPLGTSAITLNGGLVLRGASGGGTTDTIGAIATTQLGRMEIVVENGATISSGTLTSGGNIAPLVVDLTGGGSFTPAGLSGITETAGILQQGSRANLYVKDSGGIGFGALSGSSIVRYTGATALTASNSSNTTNFVLSSNVTRSAALAFQTLAIDTAGGPVTLAMGSNSLTVDGNGRGLLVTGTGNASITGSGAMTGSINIANYSTGTLAVDLGVAFTAIVSNGPGLVTYSTTTNPGDVYVTNGVTRFTGARNYTTNVLRVYGGGVFEIGADLNGAAAGDFTRAVGLGTGEVALLGNGGLSAHGGNRVVNLGGSAAELTWGTANFLADPSGGDYGYALRFGSASSNAVLEFQNPIALNGTTRTIEVARGTLAGGIDARLTGALSGSLDAGLVKAGLGNLVLSATSTYLGGTIVEAGRLGVDGSIAASSGVSVSAGAELGGSGRVAAITGGGLVAPGNSPGILTAPSANFSGGLDFAFEFTQAGQPTWGSAANSGNDVLRLTDLSGPFLGTATGGNVFDIYFAAADQTYRGGIFTDQNADFGSLLSGATFNYFVRDAAGSTTYEGFNYSPLPFGDVTRSTVLVASAAFADDTVTNGYTMQFVVVPEPGGLLLAGLGIAGAWMVRRRTSR